MPRRYDPTIEDPRIPDDNEFQHLALGYVERRIRLLHILLFGAGIYLASGAALAVRWIADVEPGGAALMTDLGIVVLLVSWATAGLVALRPARPSVAFTQADQAIREDKGTAIAMVVIGVILTALAAFLTGSGDGARVLGILVGMWVAIGIAVYGLLHARTLRKRRDDVYAAYLARRGGTRQPTRRVVREVGPGLEIFDSEPSEFEFEALAYAGSRAGAWAWMLCGPLFLCFLAPMLIMSWALGFDHEPWIVPTLVALGVALVCLAIGFLKLKSDRPVKVRNRNRYQHRMANSVGINRLSGMLAYILAVLVFIGCALVGTMAVDPVFVVYSAAIAICLASSGPFLIVAGRILHRRRELYTAWRIRNGLPLE